MRLGTSTIFFIKEVLKQPRTPEPPVRDNYWVGDIWVRDDGSMMQFTSQGWKETGVKLD